MSYKISGVGTALPGNAVQQDTIREFAAALFREGMPNVDRLLPVFENGAIKSRHLAQPLSWYSQQHSFADANSSYEIAALELACEAAQVALVRAGVKATDIGLVVFVSSTGIATPTLDARLMEKMNISLQAARVPLWGLGCAGGVAGLARTAELAASLQVNAALLVAVELCSLTFQRNDLSKANLVGSSIFADGAAAVVITPDGDGPAFLGSYSNLFPDTADIMGWDVVGTGLKVRFSRDIPALVRSCLPDLVANACTKWGIAQEAVRHYVVHPGGAKVLAAYEESLGLSGGELAHAYEVLADCGNMSSGTVLFVLERYLASKSPTNDYGLMLALGPGFSAEQVLFQW